MPLCSIQRHWGTFVALMLGNAILAYGIPPDWASQPTVYGGETLLQWDSEILTFSNLYTHL
jgi:hypothetical protein